jgi:hypothetical protein
MMRERNLEEMIADIDHSLRLEENRLCGAGRTSEPDRD